MGQELKISLTDAVKRMACWILQTCFTGVAKFRKKKHVLFVCHGPLMAEYLQSVYEVIRADPRLTCRLVLPSQERWKGAYDYIEKKLPIKKIPYRGQGT